MLGETFVFGFVLRYLLLFEEMLRETFGGFFGSVLRYLIMLEEMKEAFSGVGLNFYFDYASHAIAYIAISVALYAVFYVLMGIGIYKLSKKQGLKNPALSFVPFARFYQMGKLVGKTRLFGMSINNLGLITTIVSAVNFVFYNVVDVVLYARPCIELLTSGVISSTTYDATVYDMFFTVLTNASNLAFVVFYAFLVIAFFRFYEKRHPILYSLLGLLLGITGAFVFAVRDHDKYDYMAEIRKFYESRGYGGGYGGYYDGRGDGYPYDANPGGERSEAQKEKPADVFEEYSDDNKVGGGRDGATGDDDLFN